MGQGQGGQGGGGEGGAGERQIKFVVVGCDNGRICYNCLSVERVNDQGEIKLLLRESGKKVTFFKATPIFCQLQGWNLWIGANSQ